VDADDLLARLAERPAASAVLLDVDGTLAPIVERPQDAAVPDATRAILARLVSRYRLVACLSGRQSADAAHIVGVDGVRYVGEHGLELAPDAERWADRLAAFADETAWPHEAGKRLSLAFHFRAARDEEEARCELEQVAERATAAGLRARWGRKVLEIRPPIDADKGTAVQQLLVETNVEGALYAGDDTTDVDAFRGLDGLSVAVRIGVSSPEAPAALLAAADLVVEGPEGLVAVLERL
jgi:trehalose 6-phosphate phosphatase